MLAKVITLTHSRAGSGFAPVLRYLLRVDRRKDLPYRPTPESGHLHLTQEPYGSAAEDAREYARDVAAVFDNNRVHPTKFTAIDVPWRDYFLLDRCMRELELELGFARSHGPYITVDTEQGPQIVRMSRAEREARGLLQNGLGPRLSSGAQRAEHNLAAGSFQRWVTGAPSVALQRAITVPGATWQDAHNVLAEFGCVIEPKGSGMVVTTTLTNTRVLAAKASLLGRWASKASLERILGPYVPAAGPPRRVDPRRTYEQFVQRERLVRIRMRGSHDDGERLVRRRRRYTSYRSQAWPMRSRRASMSTAMPFVSFKRIRITGMFSTRVVRVTGRRRHTYCG